MSQNTKDRIQNTNLDLKRKWNRITRLNRDELDLFEFHLESTFKLCGRFLISLNKRTKKKIHNTVTCFEDAQRKMFGSNTASTNSPPPPSLSLSLSLSLLNFTQDWTNNTQTYTHTHTPTYLRSNPIWDDSKTRQTHTAFKVFIHSSLYACNSSTECWSFIPMCVQRPVDRILGYDWFAFVCGGVC